jgi:predicted TIM-barrel fold metal-dependent hydrolase
MIIDIHVHPFCKEATLTPGIQEAVERMFARHEPKRREMLRGMVTLLFTQRTVEDIIHDMDEAGIGKACIVPMDLTTHYGVEVATNEDISRIAADHPDRFIPFASVDPSLGRAAVDKLLHAVRDLGCRGLKLVPPVQHFDFSDPKHNPLWEAALDLNIPVWTHTAHQRSHPDSDARLGHPMLVEPVALKYPDLKIILGHCGFPWHWEAWSLVVRHANVYVDISAYANLYNHLPWDAYMKYGAEAKVLFASDYPLFSFQDTLKALRGLDLPPEFEKKILGENALKLLGLSKCR